MGAFAIASLLLTPVFCAISIAQDKATINGAGASFPYPIYPEWAHKYNQAKRVQINYQSIGSGGGIAQIKARTVNFGASDEPPKKAPTTCCRLHASRTTLPSSMRVGSLR